MGRRAFRWDYCGTGTYLITMTLADRSRPLFGRLVGTGPESARIELSPLGRKSTLRQKSMKPTDHSNTAPAADPQRPSPLLVATSDRDPLSYRIGEPMSFAFRATGAPQGARIRWALTGDDGRNETGELATAPAGAPALQSADCAPAMQTAGLPNPGFVRLRADLLAPDGSALAHFEGGAGADVDSIRADTPLPPDFAAFWARRRAALAAVPMDGATTREIGSPLAGVRLFEVSIPCAGSRPSTGFLSIPDRSDRFPAKIHFHGYDESWRDSAYATPTADRLSRDAIVLDLSAHGFELNREPEYYAALRAESGSNGHDYAFDPVQNSDPETAYFGGMSWRVMRGLEYLKSRPEWDRRTLIAEGGSCGGLQTIWAAALDHDVTECRPFIPWCCNLAGPAAGREHGDWFVEWVPALAYYDPVNMARLLPATCRTTITWAGLGDYICPPSGVMAFYNAIPGHKSITFIQGAMHLYVPPAPQQTDSRNSNDIP